MWTRRELMKAGLASFVAGGLSPALAETPEKGGPRYFVTMFLRGGMDAIYTADPKTKAEVEPRVDLPYGANEIVDARGLPMGPHFKQLEKWGDTLSFVRGVGVSTANHESGARQMLRLRVGVSRKMPALHDIIGQTRDTQPLGSVTLGQLISYEHSEAGFAAPTHGSKATLLHRLDALDPTDLGVLSQVFKQHLAEVERWPASTSKAATVDHLRQVAALFERLPAVPKFKPVVWSTRGGRQGLAVDLQRVLWLIENDLARGVYLKIFLDWDSHFRNASKQEDATRSFTYLFDRFLAELKARTNAHGSLLDQTMVVAGSELGRFPVLNGNLGKDHFPETHFMVAGGGVVGGQAFGASDRMMGGRKVSLATGKPDAAGTHMMLDDMGTTMLLKAGVDPRAHGYRGRRLAFLDGAA